MAPGGFGLVTDGTCASHGGAPIMTAADCEYAAGQLAGVADTTAYNYTRSYSNFPPFCYYVYGFLEFNSNGGNTGSCSFSYQCLCSPPRVSPADTAATASHTAAIDTTASAFATIATAAIALAVAAVAHRLHRHHPRRHCRLL